MVQRVAIAGATGYTGQRLLERLGDHPLWDARALVRPGSAGKLHAAPGQDHALVAPHDVAALATALAGCAAVIQTIGTTRAQFGPGVSYETVDYGTTVALIEAAQAAGVPRFLLLSSAGAGRPLGAYLQWKARTEAAVRASGLQWTILRPAAIVGPGRRLMQLASLPIDLLSRTPRIGRSLLRLRSISADQLAQCFIRCLDAPETSERVLEGATLWQYA